MINLFLLLNCQGVDIASFKEELQTILKEEVVYDNNHMI